MIEKERFAKILKYYASVLPFRAPKFDEPMAMHFWVEKFSRYDEPTLKRAFDRALMSLDHFPSPKQFAEYIGDGDQTSKEKGIEVGSRILAAIGKYGYLQPNEAKEFIGPLGWEVVQMQGGWTFVCEHTTNQNSSFQQKQWTDLGITLAEKQRKGIALPPKRSDENLKLGSTMKKALSIMNNGV